MTFDGLDDAYPLTPIQQGMLYEVLKQPDTDIYVAYIVIDICGKQDSELLRRAWQRTLEQHETLRTRFIWEDLDEPIQLVNTDAYLDWADCETTDAKLDEAIDYWLAYERKTSLSLTDNPPLRFRHLSVRNDYSVLIWTVHHLLADDWSTPIVLRSVLDNYKQLNKSSHSVDTSNSASLSYAAYVNWLTSGDQHQHELWWKQALTGIVPTPLGLQQKTGASSSTEKSAHAIRKSARLSKQQSAAIAELSHRIGVTQSSIFHTAWALVLARYAGSQYPVFGTSVSGRTAPLENLDTAVGLFLNTLPTCIRIDNEQLVHEFIQHVQDQLFEQVQHEHLALSDIQRIASLDTDPNLEDKQLFDTVLVVEAHGSALTINDTEEELSFGNIRYTTESNFPLTVLVFPNDELQVDLLGSRALFDPWQVSALSSEFIAVLNDLCARHTQRLGDLQTIQSARIEQQYPAVEYPAETAYDHIDQWIVQTGNAHPAAIAVSHRGIDYSYTTLLATACDVSQLIQAQCSDSEYVGVYLPLGFEQIAAVVGVLIAGKAYVPLDTEWPSARTQAMVADSGVSLILCDTTNQSAVALNGITTLIIDHESSTNATTHAPSDQPSERCTSDPAYMIYTSGSSGEPKGVVISHRNLVYSTQARQNYYQERPCRYLLLSSYAFDSSVAGLFWTLCAGGTLVLPDTAATRDIHELEKLIHTHKITHTLCLPSLYELLLRFSPPANLASLATVIVAGEACPPALPARHQRVLPNTRLYNEYGPTEATVWSSVAELTSVASIQAQSVPIGQAVAGSQLRIVDQHGLTCPVGTSGELVVYGPGVSRGYLADPALTDSRFINAAQTTDSSSPNRGYRTGDKAVLGFDGNVYFLGRIDKQMKIRGRRLEAGEIESRVQRHPAVMEAYCTLSTENTADGDVTSQPLLLCYYTLKDHPPGIDARCQMLDDEKTADTRADIDTQSARFIEQELGKHFSVAHFIAVNRLPRLPNGKINARGLPEPARHRQLQQSDSENNLSVAIQPETDTEKRLCEILAGLLGQTTVTPDDNFFTLGGDSLTAIRFVAACREKGLMITVPMVAAYSSLSELAAELSKRGTVDTSITTEAAFGLTPLTPIQRWFLATNHPDKDHWNMAFTIDLTPGIDASRLCNAINTVVGNTPILGARIRKDLTGYRQELPEVVPTHDLITRIEQSSSKNAFIDEALIDELGKAQSAFNLAEGVLIRFVVLVDSHQYCSRIGVVVHHLVTDALSILALASKIINQTNSDQDKRTQAAMSPAYRDWAIRLKDNFAYQEEPENLGFTSRESDTEQCDQAIDGVTLDKIKHFCANQMVSLPECLLFSLLASSSLPWHLRVDIETHGRDLIDYNGDISAIVGWFTSFHSLALPVDVAQKVFVDKCTSALVSFSESFRASKINGNSDFARQPLSYLQAGTDRSSQGTSNSGAILYNFLATDDLADSAMTSEAFTVTPLTDPCFRHPGSLRSHDIELIVLRQNEGLTIRCRYDRTRNTNADIRNWLSACQQFLVSMVSDQQTSGNAALFPDSGMDDDELDAFLSTFD